MRKVRAVGYPDGATSVSESEPVPLAVPRVPAAPGAETSSGHQLPNAQQPQTPEALGTGFDPTWRRTFYTLCVTQAMAMLAFGMALPFLPLFVQRLGIPDPRAAARWAGAMTSGGALVMALLAPVWGELADRYGRKPMVTRALLGGGAIVSAMSLVRSPTQLLALRLLQGAFSGTVSASRTLLASVVPAAELGFTLGAIQTAQFVGTSAGPLLGGVIADHLGYRATFAATGAVLMAGGVAVLRLVREHFVPPAPSGDQRANGVAASIRLIFEVPGLAALIGTLFFVQAGVSAVSPVLALFVQSLLPGQGENVASLAGLILGATAVTSAFAATAAGRLGDRIGHERTIAICAIGGGLLYLPQAIVTSPWQLLGLRAALGIFDGGLMPSVMATIALRSPVARRGLIFGLTAMATSLGNAAGPAAGALAASAFGLRASFILTALVLTTAGVWVALALAPRPAARPAGRSPAAQTRTGG